MKLFVLYLYLSAICVVLFLWTTPGACAADASASRGHTIATFVEENCLDCHFNDDPAGNLSLEELDYVNMGDRGELWEKVVRKLRSRQMPPADMPQPEETTYEAVLDVLESTLDAAALERPNPGRTETLRRLTKYEYENAIRDLLGIEIEAELPADEASHGFDNITVGELTPTLLNRYVAAAQKISRLAIGRPTKAPELHTYRVRPDVTQEQHVDGLPLGTRGGAIFTHNFPRDGEYEIRVRLTRDRDEHVEGLRGEHEVEFLLDRARIGLFTVRPPKRNMVSNDPYAQPTHEKVDAHLVTRIDVDAGPHDIGATFIKKSSSLLETERQPLNVHFNSYRHPRLTPALFQLTIFGPLESAGPGESPSRRRIFISYPHDEAEEESCATDILTNLMRRAYRRPVTDSDLSQPLARYRQARANGDFEAGIEAALAAIVVSPHFLFRVETPPAGATSGVAYRVSDLELANRLSFFLWSSIPDDKLLSLAESGELSDPNVLQQQVIRMLADQRSQALVESFAGQWLYLRNLESSSPDMRLFPDFDDNLRQAMRRETELCFEEIIRNDRSVLDLLRADHTFLNERLAKHYGVPNVYGSRFRRVSLPPDSDRGGLLRHGSILTVTSYATRTSPVLRGTWILENILGTPPPPPPPGVPALEENTVAANLSVRERLAAHRADPNCAACHDLIDPVGFALDSYDAIGQKRDRDGNEPIDDTGSLAGWGQVCGRRRARGRIASPPRAVCRYNDREAVDLCAGTGDRTL